MHRLIGAVTTLVIVTTTAASSQEATERFPLRLEEYLTHTAQLSKEERDRLIGGVPVTKLLDSDESKEVAVFGAVWINAPIRRYVELKTDIENFESGDGFNVTKRISTPPRPEDFAELRLPEEDIEDLSDCRVGDCEVKLSEEGLRRMRTEVDWTSDAAAGANRVMRRLAFEYVSRYLEGGNDQLAVYRDNSRPTFVAEEFRTMIEQMPALTTYMPEMRRYLLDYPNASLPDSTSFLYWQEVEFGLKPTIRISHLTVREGPEDTVVASKMLYASHYFWTALELRVLLPDPSRGPGFWFVTINRSRSDGLSGFTGFFVRRRVRGEVQAGTLAALENTRQRLEASR